ncbi:hypothetical protein OIU78_015461 [Salix suchowensis]|nr:hypothetical protein OIU78_015461 [Salix suchowensis]
MRAFAVPTDYYHCCYSSYPCLLLPPSFTNTKLSSFSPKFSSLSSQTTHPPSIPIQTHQASLFKFRVVHFFRRG